MGVVSCCHHRDNFLTTHLQTRGHESVHWQFITAQGQFPHYTPADKRTRECALAVYYAETPCTRVRCIVVTFGILVPPYLDVSLLRYRFVHRGIGLTLHHFRFCYPTSIHFADLWSTDSHVHVALPSLVFNIHKKPGYNSHKKKSIEKTGFVPQPLHYETRALTITPQKYMLR